MLHWRHHQHQVSRLISVQFEFFKKLFDLVVAPPVQVAFAPPPSSSSIATTTPATPSSSISTSTATPASSVILLPIFDYFDYFNFLFLVGIEIEDQDKAADKSDDAISETGANYQTGTKLKDAKFFIKTPSNFAQK